MSELNKRRLKARNTREKLLRVSVQLIVAEGYENVTVSRICRECGVAKGTFYTYFSSKQEIVVHILRDINVQMFAGLTLREEESPEEQLRRYQRLYMETIARQGKDLTREVFKILCDTKVPTANVSANLHQEFLERAIRQGIEEQRFRGDEPAERLAATLQDFNFGMMMRWCRSPGETPVGPEGERLIELFLDMLRAAG